MKTSILSLLAAGMLSILAPAASAQTSQKLTAGKATEYGLVYTLPLTALDFVIEAKITVETPGDFHNYARRHLGESGAITESSRRVELLSVSILTEGVPDPENRWLAQFKAGSTPYMILTPDGVPLAINTESVAEIPAPKLPTARAAAPSPLETEAARQAITAEMARSSSLSKRAELAAQRIFELREMRSDLLSGQSDNAPADGKAMQLVLDNLSAQEAALTAMFLGTRTERTVVERMQILPDSADISGRIIARLSSTEGIVDQDNVSGSPLTMNLTILEAAELPVNDKGEPKRFPKGGVAYTIPGTALVELFFQGRKVASREVSLAQLGVTFGLDPALFTDKKAPSKVQFDPATGAILLLGPADE